LVWKGSAKGGWGADEIWNSICNYSCNNNNRMSIKYNLWGFKTSNMYFENKFGFFVLFTIYTLQTAFKQLLTYECQNLILKT